MFTDFKLAVQRQFKKMTDGTCPIFKIETDKDDLWETYLNSFPEGTNPIFRERTEHDCQCCRSFIRTIGNIATIQDGKLITLWDIKVDGFYQTVADALSEYLIKSASIENIFLHNEKSVGVDKNRQIKDDVVTTWEHFHVNLPSSLISSEIGPRSAEALSTKEVMYRGLKEISLDAIDTVIDLIDQNSLYRGEENKFAVSEFRKLKIEFNKIKTETGQDIFCWSQIKISQSVARIRNTSIGTLLVNLSEGMELERAITSFEAMVAPANYKRPTAPITKAMIEKAKEKIVELGFLSSLERRFAVLEDISINNVLFADREARKRMDNVFDELASQTSSNLRNFDKVEEVSIDDFLTNILPKVTSLELMFENRHSSNLVSLIAPADITSKSMFKWNNNFSWSYAGEMADSIKERVKSAGGRVDGDLRCSLSWFNYDDLDLHMVEPDGTHIHFGNKWSNSTGGNLDVDMNAGAGKTRSAVENICYADKKRMREGIYRLSVHNYCKRESSDVGFEVEVEFDGVVHSFSYAGAVKNLENIVVAEIQYTHKDGFKIIKSLPSTQAVKNVWNIPTQTFHKVSLVLLSPNHWDDKTVGNKHFFFMLDGCLNDGKARGFFNEFLSSELDAHRKVFEVVGSKMKTEESENQLSGLGFSSTQRNSVLCKVNGSFSRTIKILF